MKQRFFSRRHRWCCSISLSIFLSLAPDSRAEEPPLFPAKPIEVIVPFKPGGGSDTFARIIQKAVRDHELLPQPLVILNIPGAGATIGSQEALHANPDGYTILFLHEGILTARYSGQAKWGPEDFEAIAATGEVGAVIAVAEDSDFLSLDQLLATTADKPDEITFGSNIGAPSHFWALLLENAIPGSRFRYVQTGGGADRFAALIGGHVAVTAFSVSEYIAFREGGIRAIAILGEKRHPALPEVPTGRESGVDVVAGNIQCWWAPKGTPPDRVAAVAGALRKAMETPEVRRRLAELQIDPVFLEGDNFRAEIEKRRTAISAVAPRAILGLPDLPLFFGVATIACGLWLLIAVVRSNRVESPTQSCSIENQGSRFRGLIITVIAIGFALLLQSGQLPFPVSCVILVVSAGVFLLPDRRHGKTIAGLTVFAALLGFGLDFVFSQFFSIHLP